LNVDWISTLPPWMRRGMYFSLQSLIGSRIVPVWREFLSWEKATPDQLNQQIEIRLSRLLGNATQSSAYYRELGIRRSPNESAVHWLRRFPVLGRVALRERFTEVVTDSLRNEITSPDAVSKRRYDWLVVKTGGSTGVPTTVVHDATARDWGRSTRLYAARLCGFPLGTPYFRLWGSEQDLLKQQTSLSQRLMHNLHAEVSMNAFRAREADLRSHLETLQSRPEIHHLMAYVDAAAGLADFIQEHHLTAPTFKTIMACAGTVTPEFRQSLANTFKADVFDKYGSRECGDMACECSHHTGLHVFSPNVFLEIVNDQDQPCPPGEPGRILVTLLNNHSFPMIRYEVGDMATWAPPGPCPCGSAFPRIQSLQGRQDDMLVTEDGTWQTSVFVRHFVGVSLNRQLIREWQLEQTGRTSFVFRYIALNDAGLADNLARLKESFRLVFGSSAEIQMLPVTEIPPSPSGKIRWIINSYRKR
jgi:phenylacetate-CoA ligase